MPSDVPSDVPSVVRAYWRYHALAQGDRAQRLAAEQHSWAWEAVDAAVREAVVRGGPVLELLDALLAAPDADPCYLGAGPVEDLLTADGSTWAQALADRCRRSSRWREALAFVVLDEHARRSLPHLRPYLVRGT